MDPVWTSKFIIPWKSNVFIIFIDQSHYLEIRSWHENGFFVARIQNVLWYFWHSPLLLVMYSLETMFSGVPGQCSLRQTQPLSSQCLTQHHACLITWFSLKGPILHGGSRETSSAREYGLLQAFFVFPTPMVDLRVSRIGPLAPLLADDFGPIRDNGSVDTPCKIGEQSL